MRRLPICPPRFRLPVQALIRRLALILALLSAFAPASPALADRALVIGIDAYGRDPNIGPLDGAVADALRMQSYLLTEGVYAAEQVLLLADGAATRAAILSAIEDWLIAGTRPGERVLLFYAGHGGHVPGLQNPAASDQVLIPVDSHFDDAGELRDFIRDKELAALLERLNDRQVTVIVDSCFSGDITRGAPLPDDRARMRTIAYPARPGARSTVPPAPGAVLIDSRPGRTVWSAASATQPSWETTRDGAVSGVFTSAFLDGLAGEADAEGNGVITHLELHNWLLDVSARACSRISRCLALTPTLEVARALQVAPVASTLAGLAAAPVPGAATLAETVLVPPAVATPVTASDGGEGGRVTLRIASAEPLREGDAATFIVEADFDGYLTLVDINPLGEATQLFPNRFSAAARQIYGQGGDRIGAGQPVRLPDSTYGFAFTVQPPFGDGVLVAVVTADPVDLSDLASVSRSLILMGPDVSSDWLLRLRDRLRQPIVDADGIERQPRYAIGTRSYLTQVR